MVLILKIGMAKELAPPPYASLPLYASRGDITSVPRHQTSEAAVLHPGLRPQRAIKAMKVAHTAPSLAQNTKQPARRHRLRMLKSLPSVAQLAILHPGGVIAKTVYLKLSRGAGIGIHL